MLFLLFSVILCLSNLTLLFLLRDLDKLFSKDLLLLSLKKVLYKLFLLFFETYLQIFSFSFLDSAEPDLLKWLHSN